MAFTSDFAQKYLVNVQEGVDVGENYTARKYSGSLLGQGGFGTVYYCTERATGKNYAAKVFAITTKEQQQVIKIVLEVNF